jgi:forkhead box protein J2/3
MSQQLQPLPPLMGDQQEDLSQASTYYQQEPNDLTGGLPINLDSLRDGPPGSKPFYPYSTLIRCVLSVIVVIITGVNGAKLSYAIKGSPNQKLLLEDIYYAIESRVCFEP